MNLLVFHSFPCIKEEVKVRRQTWNHRHAGILKTMFELIYNPPLHCSVLASCQGHLNNLSPIMAKREAHSTINHQNSVFRLSIVSFQRFSHPAACNRTSECETTTEIILWSRVYSWPWTLPCNLQPCSVLQKQLTHVYVPQYFTCLNSSFCLTKSVGRGCGDCSATNKYFKSIFLLENCN